MAVPERGHVVTGYAARRTRSTRDEMEGRHNALVEIVRENAPCSVRSVYYRAVVAGVVPKTTSGYDKVQRAVAKLRLDGRIPFSAITDTTRWQRKPSSWNSVDELLDHVASTYRRNLWTGASERVEVWAESDSIAGVIGQVTEAWDVPLMVTRGYSSLSFAHSAAEDMNHDGRPAVVYYVGDHDPHGLEIEQKLIEYLRRWADVTLYWGRVGVTWDQVLELNLPGTTPKKSYGYPLAVEAEALPPPALRQMLSRSIAQHVDARQLELHDVAEASEREVLVSLARGRRA